MKIYAPFPDYYDPVQHSMHMLLEPVSYTREVRVHPVSHEPTLAAFRPRIWANIPGNNYLQLFWIGIAGEWFPGVLYENRDATPMETHLLVGDEAILQPGFLFIQKVYSDKDFHYRHQNYPVTLDEWRAYLVEADLFQRFKAPVLVLTGYSSKEANSPAELNKGLFGSEAVLLINPTISPYGAMQVVDAYTAYTRIAAFISQQLSEQPELPDTRSNLDKLRSKGFDDKQSFRHRL